MKKYDFKIIRLFLLSILALAGYGRLKSQDTAGHYMAALGFYENKGQIVTQNYVPNPAVRYLLYSPGINIQLRQTGFSYDTYTDSSSNNSATMQRVASFKGLLHKKNKRHFHRVDVELSGCNPNSPLIAEGKSAAYYNYFTTGKPSESATHVHYFNKVTYKNIYPHIDLVFFVPPENEKGKNTIGVEYNFVIHKGGNPENIKLAYKGADIKLENNRRLGINVSGRELTESIPLAFVKDTKQPVRVVYRVIGNNAYGFSIPDSTIVASNPNSDIVIDPVPNLAWGSYFGDGGVIGFGITLDAGDNIFITGQTESATGIATTGAYQTILGDGVDAFIAKFNSTGTSLIWGTYYGGTEDVTTIGNSIAVDANDEVYVSGYTDSPSGIATTSAYQTTYGGSGDAFVAKFNSTGSSLLWGTYYGGASEDQSNCIALDGSDNVYITGFTSSNSGIATPGAYQTTVGNINAFVAKFNSSGSSLLWGTYYGETGTSGVSYGDAIITDSKNSSVYFSGFTTSPSDIATAGAYHTAYSGGNDAFVASLNSTGSSLLWGTYYGGTGDDYGYGIAIDATDNIYMTGYTSSASGIATTGAYQTALSGTDDAFVAKFNSTGAALLWGSYYGGTGITYGYAIAADAGGNIFITGQTNSVNGIATATAYQTAYGGGISDAFLAMFNSSGASLLWGTYYEGSGQGEGTAIAIDGPDDVFVTGYTNSTSGIATAGTYMPTYGGGSDNGFIAEFNNTTIPLPITLTSFTAVYAEETNSVLTNWVVASQLNNKEFVVEKTLDGDNYIEVATVPGDGTTPFSLSYSAVDLNPSQGVSYYRLKQIDVDGHSTEFDPVPVFIGNPQNASINLYPNPVNSIAQIIYTATESSPLNIDIIDMAGRKVNSLAINNVQIGENEIPLNISSLSRGVYFLLATQALKTVTIKFVKE